MENMNTELIAKAKTAKNAEELLELAKANNVELTAEEAKNYFEQLNANGVVADDELEAVAGGAFLIGGSEKVSTVVSNQSVCPYCGLPVSRAYRKCPWCSKVLSVI